MGLFDKAKDLADQHADKVERAIDKAAAAADEKTGGKYSEQIESGGERAKGMVGDEEGGAIPGTGGRPG